MLTSTSHNRFSSLENNNLVLHPPAKINLSLLVFARRPDGFHDLHTVMAAIDLVDDLYLSIPDKKGIIFQCDGRPSPAGPDNLVYKTALLLAQHARIEPTANIYLHKRIPAGAGLGGASSDAGACLVGLNHLWGLNLPREELSGLAQKLGSDVPFFLHGPVALCTGRGEIVKHIPHHPQRSVLLIVPDINISTAQVYRNYVYKQDICNEYLRCIQYFLRHGDLESLLAQDVNSLTETAMNSYEPLRSLYNKLTDLGIGPVYMTGSGSTLYVSSDCDEQLIIWQKLIQQHNLAETRIVGFQNQILLFPEVQHANL